MMKKILLFTLVVTGTVSAYCEPFDQPRANRDQEDPCASLRSALPEPRLDVSSQFNGSTSNQLRGNIEGVCLSEAGVFQNGRKVENISMTRSSEFKRIPFSLMLRRGTGRELRVYNTQGGMASFPIADPDDSADPLGLGALPQE